MKKIIAVVCVACSQNTAAKEPQTKVFNYTIINETGKEISNIYLADDNSANKAEAIYDGKGLENGGKVGISVSAVPDKDGNPSLTTSYTMDDTEYLVKRLRCRLIKLKPHGGRVGHVV